MSIGRRNDGPGLFWFMVATLGMTAFAATDFTGAGVCGAQSSVRPDGIGVHSPSHGRGSQVQGMPASSKEQQAPSSLVGIEDAEETLPQFVIQGSAFTVVVRKQRLKWAAQAGHKFDPDDDETARSFEVRDAAGLAVFRQKIEEPASESDLAAIRKQGGFGFTEAVSASRMQGAKRQALVISWSSLPSAPDACSTHVVLGLFEGKLVPFSEPFCEDIVSSGAETPDGSWSLKKDSVLDFEVFEIRRSYGFFHVVIPIRVDFVMARLFPARWCLGVNAPLAEYCEFPVEAERRPLTEDTFVRLFAAADETGIPRHVVVKPDSRVEFLAALAPNAMDRSGRWQSVGSGENPWLKVRIDGREGWVRAEEDLNALGLFQAG